MQCNSKDVRRLPCRVRSCAGLAARARAFLSTGHSAAEMQTSSIRHARVARHGLTFQCRTAPPGLCRPAPGKRHERPYTDPCKHGPTVDSRAERKAMRPLRCNPVPVPPDSQPRHGTDWRPASPNSPSHLRLPDAEFAVPLGNNYLQGNSGASRATCRAAGLSRGRA